MLGNQRHFEGCRKKQPCMRGYASRAIRMRIVRQPMVMKNLSCRTECDQKDAEDREDNSSKLARARWRLRDLHFLAYDGEPTKGRRSLMILKLITQRQSCAIFKIMWARDAIMQLCHINKVLFLLLFQLLLASQWLPLAFHFGVLAASPRNSPEIIVSTHARSNGPIPVSKR